MLIDLARQFKLLSTPNAGVRAAGFRVGTRIGLASLLLLFGAGSVHDATAENETRTLSFHHTHSGEDLTITFKRNGRYDEEALKQLNHYLRDWRTQEQTVMDPHLFDIIWEVYRDVDGKQPIQIVSAYRSPATNAMLRRRSAHSGVARFSQHMLGHAMDLYIPGVPLEQIRFAGLRLQRGGVGFYPTSGSPFVHLDTGSIRHWPRMTHDQLVKVFPDGRTVHIPSDGVPLKGYELAKADIERRGDEAGPAKPSFLEALFKGSSKASDDEDDAAGPTADEQAAPVVVAAKPVVPTPLPRAKPRLPAALQLASADAQVVQPLKAKAAAADEADAGPETPVDIINARGFWGDSASAPKQESAAQVIAAVAARKALEAADPQSTASASAPYQAMAYAPPASSPVDRANIVAVSAPISRTTRPSAPRNLNVAAEINAVAAPGASGQSDRIVDAARISAARGDEIWLRIVMLAPSVTTGMSVTVMGDTDMTQMRAFFVKPQTSISMGFSDDPMQGLSTDHFSGSATTKLKIAPFSLRAALLQ
ncbi:MAG TPA: DUF882 domain-containing protein [Bradyrhizobium sp.]|uniref:DUF882 domain-containing protein n=1 Tax=Bradyrhizobium sp. TaxID=376 RepID=UPI002C6B10F1|nr:DUF882 domain-containing protein [Bradyrhizobium sp.]HLZ04017.1 DUF882 domain-containing protein [Bradyrhizobium sp.]